MLLDLNSAGGAVLNAPFDVCISGSGPAGLPLAVKLAERGHRVLLLEAGGEQFTEKSKKVYEGALTGLPYFKPHDCRQRFFGGTSNHWGGWCGTLQKADFEVHEHIPHSGWPITKADLDPYYDKTRDILHTHEPEVADYLLQGTADSNLRKRAFEFSEPPVRMAQRYGDTVRTAANIVCLLNANVVDIELHENLQAVRSLSIADYQDNRFSARARHYVLCHGGIENPRTLLSANRQIPRGVGNEHDLVGRFFMEHPHFTVGYGLIDHDHPGMARFAKVRRSEMRPAIYEPREDFQRRQQTLNFGLRFVPRPGMGLPAPKTTFKKRLKRLICESDRLLEMAESIDDSGLSCPFDMIFKTAAEQQPNRDSRIMLGDATDRFGNRRVAIQWRMTELDKHTLRESGLQAGRLMAEQDLGRVRIPDWLLADDLSFPSPAEDEVGGYHHMGTTRMAETPQAGVVDRNLKVFGIDNLYLGGSSVFATSGHVNPTFTIVQLSLRLADHLGERIGSGTAPA